MRERKQLSKLIKVQSASGITKCGRLLLQSASGITKSDRLLLQSASGITKCDSYYKVRPNNIPMYGGLLSFNVTAFLYCN